MYDIPPNGIDFVRDKGIELLCSGVDMVRVIGGAAVNNGDVLLDDDSIASAEPSASTREETRCSPTLMVALVSSWWWGNASGLPLLLTFLFITATINSQLPDFRCDRHSFLLSSNYCLLEHKLYNTSY